MTDLGDAYGKKYTPEDIKALKEIRDMKFAPNEIHDVWWIIVALPVALFFFSWTGFVTVLIILLLVMYADKNKSDEHIDRILRLNPKAHAEYKIKYEDKIDISELITEEDIWNEFKYIRKQIQSSAKYGLVPKGCEILAYEVYKRQAKQPKINLHGINYVKVTNDFKNRLKQDDFKNVAPAMHTAVINYWFNHYQKT